MCQSVPVTLRLTNGIESSSLIALENPWGDWAWPEMCPDGFFASGFSLKVGTHASVSEGTPEPRVAVF